VETGIGRVPNGCRVMVSEETDVPGSICRPVVVLPVHLGGCPGRVGGGGGGRVGGGGGGRVGGGGGGRDRHPRHPPTSISERI